MEIRISPEDVVEIVAEHFKNKGYQLEGCLPVAFQKENNDKYYFSVLIKFDIKNSVSF